MSIRKNKFWTMVPSFRYRPSKCSPCEQEVSVYFNYDDSCENELSHAMMALQHEIEYLRIGRRVTVELNRVDGCGIIHMFGPTAKALFIAGWHVLVQFDFLANTIVVLRHGPPRHRVRQTYLELGGFDNLSTELEVQAMDYFIKRMEEYGAKRND